MIVQSGTLLTKPDIFKYQVSSICNLTHPVGSLQSTCSLFTDWRLPQGKDIMPLTWVKLSKNFNGRWKYGWVVIIVTQVSTSKWLMYKSLRWMAVNANKIRVDEIGRISVQSTSGTVSSCTTKPLSLSDKKLLPFMQPQYTMCKWRQIIGDPKSQLKRGRPAGDHPCCGQKYLPKHVYRGSLRLLQPN